MDIKFEGTPLSNQISSITQNLTSLSSIPGVGSLIGSSAGYLTDQLGEIVDLKTQHAQHFTSLVDSVMCGQFGLSKALKKIKDTMMSAMVNVFNKLPQLGIMNHAFNLLSKLARVLSLDKLGRLISGAINNFTQFVSDIWDDIKDKVSDLFGGIFHSASDLLGHFKKLFSKLGNIFNISGMLNVAQSLINKFTDMLDSFEPLGDIFGKMKDTLGTVLNKLNPCLKQVLFGKGSVDMGAVSSVAGLFPQFANTVNKMAQARTGNLDPNIFTSVITNSTQFDNPQTLTNTLNSLINQVPLSDTAKSILKGISIGLSGDISQAKSFISQVSDPSAVLNELSQVIPSDKSSLLQAIGQSVSVLKNGVDVADLQSLTADEALKEQAQQHPEITEVHTYVKVFEESEEDLDLKQWYADVLDELDAVQNS